MKVNRTIFICTDVSFPRSSAGGNYIQYLAKALISVGWKVIIIASGTNRLQDKDDKVDKYFYNGIQYDNFEGNINKKFSNKKAYKNVIKEKFEKNKMSDKDYAIFYGSNLEILKSIATYIKKEHIYVCRVEMHQSFQYKLGRINPNYIKYKKFFKYVYSNIKQTLPISTNIEAYEKSKGCKTFLLPIMADPFEYVNEIKILNNEKIKIIYSGAKKTNFEDELENMLISFLKLDKKILMNTEFHITGTSKEKIRKILTKNNFILDEIEKYVILHEWLEYDQLIELYKNMDYLFLARKNNAITRSNFPSKVPETLSFGIIPICTNVGDYTTYYLRDGYDSIIFEGSSVENCLTALTRALSMPKEERIMMKYNARKTAINRFYYKEWAHKISDFIKES